MRGLNSGVSKAKMVLLTAVMGVVVAAGACRSLPGEEQRYSRLQALVGQDLVLVVAPILDPPADAEKDYYSFQTCLKSKKTSQGPDGRAESSVVLEHCTNAFLMSSPAFQVQEVPLRFGLSYLDGRSLSESERAQYIERQKVLKEYQDILREQRWLDLAGLALTIAGTIRLGSMKEVGRELMTKPGMKKLGAALMLIGSGFLLIQVHVSKSLKAQQLREEEIPRIQSGFAEPLPAALHHEADKWLLLMEQWPEIVSQDPQDQVPVGSVKGYLRHLARYIDYTIFEKNLQYAYITHACVPVKDEVTGEVTTDCESHLVRPGDEALAQ